MKKKSYELDYVGVTRNYLEDSGHLLQEKRHENYSAFIIRIPASPAPTLLFYIRVDREGLLTLNGYLAFDLSGERLRKGVELANTLNSKYSFFKNVIDTDGDFDIRYELFLSDSEEEARDQLSGLIHLLIHYVRLVAPKILSLIAEEV